MEFPQRVAEHYASRGYEVRERVKVRGQSGAIWAVDMVAQGTMGNLLITFGGHDGVDDADIIQIKRVAKDVGASAVVASEALPPELIRLANREGVAILDRPIAAPKRPHEEERPIPSASELHPWPQSGQASDPARTALRSVALDDLLGEAPDAPDAAPETPLESPRAPSTPEAAALWGKKRKSEETKPPEHAASRPQGKFGWLSGADHNVGQGGGYEFPDPEPVRKEGRHQIEVGANVETRDTKTSSKDAVLADVRQRVAVPRDRPTTSTRTAPPAATEHGMPEWQRNLTIGVLAGVVAAILLWVLLRFGP